MKLKSGRALLAAILMATLFVPLAPPSRAESGQSQNSSSPSKPRRGKNGELIPAASGAQDPAVDPGSVPNPPPDQSKVATPAQTVESKPSVPQDKNPPSLGSSTATTSKVEQTGSQQEQDAPPFDRPSIWEHGRAKSGSQPRSTQQTPSTQQPTYSDSDATSRRDPRPQVSRRDQSSQSGDAQRNRFPESSTANEVDPEPTNRSGGRPPVLQRPADSRSRTDGTAADGNQPPVLHRRNDAPSRDDNSSSGAGRQAPAQQPDGATHAPTGEDDVIKLESTLINLPILVSDRSGRYIPQLSARDFMLYEDGVQQTIASFGTEEVPFSVVLLLDVSPSVQGNIEHIQDAAIAFVRQLRSQDRVMVVSFDRSIHYLSPFTSDRRELESAIRQANTGSGTSVYDAVYETVSRKFRNIEGRKALILFSDGEDTTSSRASHDDAVNLVTESDVLVYGLRYPGNGGASVRVDPWPRSPIPGIQLPFPWPFPRRRRGPFRLGDWTAGGNNAVPSPQWRRNGRGGGGDFMADITAAGGGPVYDAERVGDMSRVAQRIADELRHVYVISYYPTNPLSNGGYRSVRVSVKNRDDIAVRHRKGYNARPNGTGRPSI